MTSTTLIPTKTPTNPVKLVSALRRSVAEKNDATTRKTSTEKNPDPRRVHFCNDCDMEHEYHRQICDADLWWTDIRKRREYADFHTAMTNIHAHHYVTSHGEARAQFLATRTVSIEAKINMLRGMAQGHRTLENFSSVSNAFELERRQYIQKMVEESRKLSTQWLCRDKIGKLAELSLSLTAPNREWSRYMGQLDCYSATCRNGVLVLLSNELLLPYRHKEDSVVPVAVTARAATMTPSIPCVDGKRSLFFRWPKRKRRTLLQATESVLQGTENLRRF